MKKTKKHFYDVLITFLSLLSAFGLSLLFDYIFNVEEHITTIFVFAVFMISLLTDGYLYGALSAFVGTIAVNYAFTFPYFALNFVIPVNLISGVIMMGIAVLTSALTTKLKQHEALKSEGEMERMRANLLRAVSHDLRTPLTTIYASSTTLIEDGKGMSEEQKRKIISGIKEDAEWLVRMVENLLSITKIDAGQIEIIKTPTVLEELMDSVLLKFRKRYPEQKVNIDLPDEMIIIGMDAILIEQVLVNILENAVQHAEGMKTLSLRVFASGKLAIFEISDDGCGIPQSKIPILFTGYHMSDAAVSDGKKKNAGIGLSVCSTIVKAHGGSITAENRKTGGAVFRFSLEMEEVKDEPE